MKYKGKIEDPKDLVTKEFVDNSVSTSATTINSTISQVKLDLEDNIATESSNRQQGDSDTLDQAKTYASGLIVDNLESTSATNALSANQGNVLNTSLTTTSKQVSYVSPVIRSNIAVSVTPTAMSSNCAWDTEKKYGYSATVSVSGITANSIIQNIVMTDTILNSIASVVTTTTDGLIFYTEDATALSGTIYTLITINDDYEPQKGDLITMDLGTTAAEGTNNLYRILKMNGTQALVLAMYNYDTGAVYSTGTSTTFTDSSGNTYTGLKYEDSALDTRLNTTVYGAMNDTAKAAIIPQNIVQTAYPYGSGTSTDFDLALETNYSGTYEYLKNKGSVSVGERYVFALDMTDVAEYFGGTATTNQLMQLFYNEDKPSSDSEHASWLRSASGQFAGYNAWYIYSDISYVCRGYYEFTQWTRAAFVIDLSKVAWAKA